MPSQPLPEFPTPSRGAKYMLALGFHVLRLKPRQKTPAINDWPTWSKNATEGTVSTCDPDDNWGIHPGLSGHFVLDVDRGQGKEGGNSLRALEDKFGELPRTLTVETPSGGLHYYFKGKGENSASRVGLHLDTKALNGYVVAPGSILDLNGREVQYNIVDATEPADAPQWLIDAMAKTEAPVKELLTDVAWDLPGNVASAIEYLQTAPVAVEGVNGDATLFNVFAKLKDMAISRAKARDLVIAHYNDRCEPPWDLDGDMEHFEKKLEQGFKTKNPPGIATPEARQAECRADFGGAPLPPAPQPENNNALHDALIGRRFNVENPPPRTEPMLWCGDVGIAKPGDLVVVQAKVKAGKSALLGAMMGCMMGAPDRGYDFLGMRGSNPKNLPVLHLDTEQSPEDHYDLIKRTLDRAGLGNHPRWFHSYCVTDFSMKNRKKALFYEAERLFKEYGGLCAIFLDGIGDLCEDVNEGPDSNKLVDDVYAMAIKYACPFVNVLHENHASETGKTRGHLGSQLERKAASNLRLIKDPKSGVIQLWGEKLRRGHIAKGEGPAFVWDNAKGMHVSCDTVEKIEAQKEFESGRDELLSFLKCHIEIGHSKPVLDLRELAEKGECGFYSSNPSRFVSNVRGLLELDTEFTVSQEKKNSPWVIFRGPLEFADLL